ncbi:MAG: hypothetical protein J0I97_10530 [Microbacterium sp.]|nr:hypothetical protein [Microbacterium sp.]
MTTLRSGDAMAVVVPEEGAVAASLLVHGVSVLAVTDRTAAPAEPHDAPTDEDAWVRAWRGGWQLCLPYAGSAPDAGPFHGRASQTPWTVESHGESSVVLGWEGDGLRVRREWRLAGGRLTALTTAENVGGRPVPFAPAEHLVLGDELLARRPDASSGAEPGACVAELTTDPRTLVAVLDDAAAPAGGPIAWPGDPAARWDAVDEGAARLAVLTPPGGVEASVVVRGARAVAEVRWDAAALPHAVLWQEVGATPTPPWDGRIRALGVEPTMVAHGGGPVVGGLPELAPGAVARWSCSLTIDGEVSA